jgi:DNA-directed RNA polymerase subunit F
MIKNVTPLSMAEATEYIGEEKDSEAELKKFIKRFVKLDSEEAKKMKIKLEALSMIKVKLEHIAKIIDFLPEDAESLNKIFTDVSLDEDEAKKILDIVQEFK